MFSNHIFVAAAASLLLTSGASHPITQCPTYETSLYCDSGASYTVCAGSDFEGTTLQVIKNIPNIDACAQQCDHIDACARAVYDSAGKVCHIKSNTASLTWVSNTRYDILVRQKSLWKCPNPESVLTGYGRGYTSCEGTDLQGPTIKVVKGIAGVTSCSLQCKNTDGCVQAVYDHVGRVCHIKATAQTTGLTWVVNKQYTVINAMAALVPAPIPAPVPTTAPAPAPIPTIAPVPAPASPAAKQGQWSKLIELPVIPVAGYVVPQFPESSRMLVFSSWGVDAFGGASGMTQFSDYNFKSGAVAERQVTNTKHDMFCPGISALEDGRVVISGGADAAAVSIYDPATNMFTKAPDMKIPRGYQSSVLTSEGKIFEIGGSYSGARGGKNGELYDPATNQWNLLPGVKSAPMLTADVGGVWRSDNHAWLYGWKNGSVFQAGPSKQQNWFNTLNGGSSTPAGMRDTVDTMCGINVMYEPGKILSAGGSPSYTDSDAVPRSHITTLGEPNTAASVERVPDMSFPRGFANGVALPDGTVLVTGGQRRSLVFTDTAGILVPELFNPTTKTWTVLAPELKARNYHSIALLLPDGTVFSGGGGLCYVAGGVGSSSSKCDKSVDHADGQIFSPPYLFNADGSLATRPTISALSAQSVKVGGSLTVTASEEGAKLALVRMGSSTHSINTDQRRVPLTNVVATGNVYMAQLPGDGLIIPGFYYLFVVSAKGVPSMARTVKVTRV